MRRKNLLAALLAGLLALGAVACDTEVDDLDDLEEDPMDEEMDEDLDDDL